MSICTCETILMTDGDGAGQRVKMMCRRCEHIRAFRDCHSQWESCVNTSATPVVIESPTLASRPFEEYVVDFERLLTRTAATTEEKRWVKEILRGADFNDSDMELSLIERVGAAMVHVAPYALWPPKDYFRVSIRTSGGPQAR